jgi:hypothetical protein
MIEINLIKKKKSFELPTVIGINLNQINYKILIVAFVTTSIPDSFILPELKKIQSEVETVLSDKRSKLTKLNAKVSKSKDLEGQLNAFNKQIEKLKQRSTQVEKIITLKTNPLKLLEKVARSMPENLWLGHLEINKEDKIIISGFSTTYKSIGKFIESINATPFFGKSLILDEQETLENKTKTGTSRLEKFEIKGDVQTYEPFGRDM